MTGLRVIIVDRSEAARSQLRRICEEERDIWVVYAVADVASAPRLVREVQPELITIDSAELADGGLAVIEQIMAERPIPLLILAELGFNADDTLVAQAIERGALDVQIKPTPADTSGAARLRTTIRQMARVRVVRHLPAATYAAAVPVPLLLTTPALAPAPLGKERLSTAHARTVIGFGGSAGAPSVLADILGRLPADFAACIAVVQHLPSGFVESFAGFLRTHTRLRIAIVRELVESCAGTVLLPADGCHLLAASGDSFTISREPAVRGHRPSVDVLFHSLAQHYGGRAIGIILSGIGRDGCEGLLEMRTQGAFTMAQDERSSAVYGMPRVAKECGAASLILPPEELAATLLKRPREPRP